MKTTVKLISYFLLLFLSISCNENEGEELLDEKDNITKQKIDDKAIPTRRYIAQTGDFKGKRKLRGSIIRRGKIRKKELPEKWRVITRIPNTEENSDIAIIEMTISTGYESLIIKLKPVKENAKFLKFKSERIRVSDEFVGKKLKLVSVDQNEKGEQIGKAYIEHVEVFNETVGELITPLQPKLKINKDGETFTMSIALKGDPKLKYLKLEMKEIMISSKVIPDDGGSETEEAEVLLRYLGENKDGSFMYGNSTVKFIESDNVIDMEYMTTLSVIDAGGEELDYAEFRITGIE